MATQLRNYRIADGELSSFVEEWRARIAPLRRQTGFSIDGAWTVDGESRFVWLLSFPGDWSAFEAADRAYYDSPERNALDPDPARLIADQSVTRLAEVEI
jgi:NIPSNAP